MHQWHICVSFRYLYVLFPASIGPRFATVAGCCLLFLTANAWAQQVTLAWDPVNAPNLGGYRLYYGQSTRAYTSKVNVGLQNTHTLTGLSTGQTYYFAVTAYDTNGGNESAFSNEVSGTIAAPPPVAAFAGTPATGTAPLTVAFTDTSSGSITGWSWAFGDATSSTSQHSSHTYSTPGTYSVRLTVTGPGGSNTVTQSNYITVAPPAPVAAFTGTPTSGTNPLTVAFRNASTGSITAWAWDFGDTTTSALQHPSHTYPTPGTYTVRLTVTGPGGTMTATKANYITAALPAPVAAFTGTPTSGTNPLTAAFRDASTGSITAWAWDFGDTTTSALQHPSHTYTTPGTYTVRLTVTGPGGSNTATQSNYITVTPALFEVGEITADYVWKRINFRQVFVDPIVVATPLSTNDLAPATIRIQNVESTGFDIRVQEWDYLDDAHLPETVSYLVMERGRHTLGTGIRVEAGQVGVLRNSNGSAFKTVTFTQSFAVPPVVLTSITSVNETDAVITRQRAITQSNFRVGLSEQLSNEQRHLLENVDYIAWEPSTGTIDGLTFEVQTTADVVTDRFYKINFTGTYQNTPMFLAGMQTTDHSDPATLRAESIDTTQATIYIQEESSKSHALSHTTEVVGYMVFMYQ